MDHQPGLADHRPLGGPLLLWPCYAFGRRDDAHGHAEPPFAVKVGKATLHCGSGCTLGDIAAEWIAFLAPAVAVWLGVLDLLFAFLIGIVLYGFMAVAALLVFPVACGVRLRPDMPEFWFMMQLAMLCGFATSYPVYWWLLRRGLKEAM